MSRKMHLALLTSGAGNHVAGWRMPDAEFGSENLDLITRAVQSAERGCFDIAFFADSLHGAPDAPAKNVTRLEPLTLLGALCTATSKIGLAATVSTTYSEPYNIARAFASLDRMSNGRAGWNVVTGASPEAAGNFGTDPFPDHAARYGRAREYLDVCKGLWDSWDDGAMVGDKQSGTYVDASKMHRLNHEGEHFSVRGPLNANRPPQGYPVILQAGASPSGLDFAARTADVVFASQQMLEDATVFSDKLRGLVEAAGRPRDALKILFGVMPVIGRTEEEAKEKVAALGALSDPDAAMRALCDRVGHDLTQCDLDAPLPELPETNMMQGHSVVLRKLAKTKNMTVRELRDYVGASSGHRLVMGTPDQIADDLALWFTSGAADGFMVLPAYLPGPVDDFVNEIIPRLQAKGLFRTAYEGSTLRDHLGLDRPPHPAQAAAPAREPVSAN
ncbi:LLM class flavin-dependent oxidoreductase [Salipiger abyssi]|uniref:FMN-dependent oxidoreductase, nitrilotriacetate monooxygenase family n=1 Tax=Salipiger abyssi TaxID=1250539 RepID=A0A1P8UMG6_9RHOB|nr:LLM class flavin-dependent oxidoreductase [Salipiger abyssi]APZ50586.1 FMN-dependent oxidoreductase, nitrilotriacetate monooxygenase family [Salipiger abyssi]